MIELRCPSKMFGILTDEGLLEVKCNSARCGHDSATVVLHYFDPATMLLKETKTYKEPSSLFQKERT